MRLLLLLALPALLAAPAVASDTNLACEATPKRHAVRITGEDGALPQVAGDEAFFQALDNGWVFALIRAELGWSIRVFDREPIRDAADLTAATPPLRGAPNPRDILGWHFRNKANTAPNRGDVNAPQALRAFVISPSVAATGDFKPSEGGSFATKSDDGLGWLKVVDYGLANPEPGTKARMNYLKFDACLTWPRSDEERDHLLDRASTTLTDEDREVFGTCGLDLSAYDMVAPFPPRTIQGDFDGDGSWDDVVRVQRKSDRRTGLALCRAGTWLDIVGYERLGALRTGFLDQLEA